MEPLLDLIIVDDEPAILEGLEKTFDWEQYGFRVAGTALSGEKALELAKAVKPDVLMTDIRMRRMDGLELIRRCRGFTPNPEFVIVSAHNDFEYAQEACGLGVFSFLLKPVDEEQIGDVMCKLAERCYQRRGGTYSPEEYRSFVSEHSQAIETLLLRKFLECQMSDTELAHELARLNSDLDETGSYCCVCFDIKVSNRILIKTDLDTHRYAVSRHILDQLGRSYNLRTFDLPDGRTIGILADRSREGQPEILLESLLRKLTKEIEQASGLIYAIGKFSAGFAGMRESFEHSIRALDLAVAVGVDRSSRTHTHQSKQSTRYPHRIVMEIIRAIRWNNNDGIKAYLLSFDEWWNNADLTGKRLAYQRLCNDICSFFFDTDSLEEQELSHMQRYSGLAFQLEPEDMLPVLEEILLEVIETRQQRQFAQVSGQYDNRIREAELYVEGRLGDDSLSIADAAEHVHLNSAYFGRLFKEINGIHFSEFVRAKRTEKASQLLISTDLSVLEIAEEVGIPNTSYFSTVFRKLTGKSPTEYRKNSYEDVI